MRTGRFSLLALLPLVPAAQAGKHDKLAEVVAAFEARTGAKLVFTEAEIPAGEWFDIKIELDAARRLDAATIALAEAKKYPTGFLGQLGLEAVAIFDGLASSEGDGYRPWNDELGGYRYFGQWNGADGVIAAYYTDEQLPLTLHHEIFHHVDSRIGGDAVEDAFTDDDARFAAAIAGDDPYAAPSISKADLAALEALSSGIVMDDAVSDYSAKGAGEDQAETARQLMTALPDALVQIATQPELAGSQRFLHVIDQYRRAVSGGPDASWLVDVALGREPSAARRLARKADALELALRLKIGDDTAFRVRGSEDADGVNQTLRGDLAQFGKVARAMKKAAKGVKGGKPVLAHALGKDLRLLARYHEFIASRWTVTAGTERSFTRARDALLAGIKAGDKKLAKALTSRTFADLAVGIADTGELAKPRARDNPYLHKVDDEIADKDLRAAIRAVQPAAVRLGGGSGVNLDAHGVILTAGHVVDALGKQLTVEFPDGTKVEAVTIAYDATLDLAVLEVDGANDLPWAPLAPAAPVKGDTVVVIGQPGKWTPDGEETGYQPWNVSVGEIRGFRGGALDDQSLGGTKHDAWTYWGHSGSPLYDSRGRIVALHNSWDSTTAMRHAVRYEAIVHFLDEAGVTYHVKKD